ncbi:hypothetical protein QNK12_03060 [Neobacillus cucumis]|nr:hypothetical protein QNK12_03060 [Neobacillus cucumis]
MGVGLTEIIKECNISKGSFYHHLYYKVISRRIFEGSSSFHCTHDDCHY